MRYPQTHKADAKTRILKTAAQLFREHGRDAVTLARVMSATGMTVGGFYKHFADKDQLFIVALETAFDQLVEQVHQHLQRLPHEQRMKALIQLYLSEDHLNGPGGGCALAALGSELNHLQGALHVTAGAALIRYAAGLSEHVPGKDPQQRHERTQVLLASMAGVLIAARALSDPTQRASLLHNARQQITLLVDQWQAHPRSRAI